MNRRGFIKPQTLARSAGGLYRAFTPTPAPHPHPQSTLELIRVSRRAMACQFEVALPLGDARVGELAELVLDRIDSLEDQLTVYRPDSEVSQLNRRAADEAIIVEPELFALFRRAADLTRQTEGAFDIATGALIKAWGFFAREGRVPTRTERTDAMSRTGFRHVILDDSTRSVRFRRRGLEINLGAIGKGYALDRAARDLQRFGVKSAQLNGGHSSIRTIGTPPGRSGWMVDLHHPWRSDVVLGTFHLNNCGLGTSAATYQSFEYQGRRLGHLLDPRIGWPAEGTALVSVRAPTAEMADALSTAFFVMGPSRIDWVNRFCAAHPEIGVVMLPNNDPAELLIWNLAPHEFRRKPDADPMSGEWHPTNAKLLPSSPSVAEY